MKFTTLFLLICTMHLSATSFSQTVSIDSKEKPAIDVLHHIKKQTGFNFLFNDRLTALDRKVDISANQMSLTNFLTRLLNPLDLKYVINGQTIFISQKNSNLIQSYIKHGIVRDSTGHIIVAVTIRNLRSKKETFSSNDGTFTIEVRHGDELEFSALGYQGRILKVSDKDISDVVLSAQVDHLDEVVVVGYGTQKRRDVTGAISSVPKDRLEMIPQINIAQAIQGAIPGVVVQQSMGGSNPQSSILIRGRNSILASNEPLIVMDGIPYPGNLSDINVNEVKSIDVLKDASATAIYGSRGANGVIIITTKTGSGQHGTRLAYDGKFSFQSANDMPSFMDAAMFRKFKEEREPGNLTQTEEVNWNEGLWTDWKKEALRDGYAVHNNITVDGTADKTNFLLSANHLKVQGQTLNDEFERINGRVAIQTQLSKTIKIGTNTQISSLDFGGAPIDWEDVLRINPLLSAYDAEGRLLMYPWPEFTDIVNPLEPMHYEYEKKSFQILSNNFLEIQIPFIEGLSYKTNFGVQRQWGNMSNYRDRTTAVGFTKQGYYTAENSRNNYLLWENIMSYRRSFGQHQFDWTALYSYEKNKTDVSSLEASGFPHDFINQYAIAQADYKLPSFDYSQTILLSQMLRMNYNYDGRYLLTVTGRRDGYSGFGQNKKWGLFPSLGLGWNLTQEHFGLNAYFQELKIRGSYGVNGNQAVKAYETISRLTENNNVSGTSPLPGYVPTKLGQDELGWESSKTLNVGLDFAVLNNRLSGSVNYYQTDTYDLLLNRTISPVHGITSITQNIGKTNNNGLEAIVNFEAITKGDFKWFSSFNFASNSNKIVSLYGIKGEDGKEIDDLANLWFIGQPISINQDWKFIGVWQTDENAEAAKYQYIPGDSKFLDVDGDYKKENEDKVFLGQRDPKFTWGFTNNFSYKGISLSVFLHGIHGVTRLNSLLQDASSSSGVRRNVIAKNWWTPENPTNEYYANTIKTQTLPIYQDASFVRVKDITLSYNFPGNFEETLGMKNLRVYANVRNPHTWTKWTTNDPELDFGRGGQPLAKEFVIGLNFNY
ncbi:SusC/RagA family TonB-linked outer membrane protein [Sphingobacterium sp. SYP-B4668]|uniref:SusC/RagA family TonB-linked outer membrane protein n=1 Tax=Sphingobacterium sp. SYP-B4668 TaxID=2996035 RepID=UPI0022DD1A87|nr:SusC/RagA family TonB-linked outer membrane protein [Sphingobacterium sp. SYP-B4668]